MIKVTVEVWSYLCHLFGIERPGRHSLEVRIEEGTTLADLVRRLADENPRFAEVMYKPNTHEPSGHVTVVVNGRMAELADDYKAKLCDDDHIILVQAYAGG